MDESGGVAGRESEEIESSEYAEESESERGRNVALVEMTGDSVDMRDRGALGGCNDMTAL